MMAAASVAKSFSAIIKEREELWKELKDKQDAFLNSQARMPIKIQFTDKHGTESEMEGKSWETTPQSIAMQIKGGIEYNSVVAKVNGELWDLDRPFEKDSTLSFLDFDDPDGKYVFRHSSAHILGEAMENFYGGHLCYGPPIEDGFYYDMHLADRQVKPDEFKDLNKMCKNIAKQNQKFERLEMTKEDLLRMFAYNEFKCRIIRERVQTPKTTVYKCGPLIDLCRGPHVRHTGKCNSMKVTKASATYWEGNQKAESLQRIYGISFPNKELLEDWEKFQIEAAKRDHRKIGTAQRLFFFHEYSPGSCFFLPKGTIIYNRLTEFIRNEYWSRGYQEVISPNMFNHKLWETSGHWKHYKDDVFQVKVDEETWALKPMNCPGHCLVFQHFQRSYKELPIRMADFGILHRNEASGALTGLTRVRRFVQDDAHIFCTEGQLKEEINRCFDFFRKVSDVFHFGVEFYLSTRPEKAMGSIELWNRAEAILTECLNDFNQPWKINAGDGAFYGPKIDIYILDALRRKHQVTTIQLDFQQPINFNLRYMTEAGEKTESTDGNAVPASPEPKKSESGDNENQLAAGWARPVVIHRAMLGSLERFFAIVTENYAGKWPFWLSPFQTILLPVKPQTDAYAKEVQDMIHSAGFVSDIDNDAGRTLNKKIRNAQLAQYNFILVVGDKEAESKQVNVRTRDEKVHGTMSLDVLIERLRFFSKHFVRDEDQSFTDE